MEQILPTRQSPQSVSIPLSHRRDPCREAAALRVSGGPHGVCLPSLPTAHGRSGQGGAPAVAGEAGVVQRITTAMECAGRSHASRSRLVHVTTPGTKGRAAAVSVTQRAAAEPRDGFRSLWFHRTTRPLRDAHDVRRHQRSEKARQDDQV